MSDSVTWDEDGGGEQAREKHTEVTAVCAFSGEGVPETIQVKCLQQLQWVWCPAT